MHRSGFTLIELFVAITLVLILTGMVIPVSVGCQNQALSAQCYSNLRQINTALHVYSLEHKGFMPHEDNGSTRPPKNCGWAEVLPPIVHHAPIWHCPVEDPQWRSYKMNSLIQDEAHVFVRMARLEPQKLILFFDGRVDNTGVRLAPKGTWALATDRHPDGTHLLLLNGAIVSYDSGSTETKGWASPGPYYWEPLER